MKESLGATLPDRKPDHDINIDRKLKKKLRSYVNLLLDVFKMGKMAEGRFGGRGRKCWRRPSIFVGQKTRRRRRPGRKDGAETRVIGH